MITTSTTEVDLDVTNPIAIVDIAAKEQQLDAIKTTVEQLNKTQQMEVLKIFKKHPLVKLNENRNGVYINLSYLPEETIQELNLYLQYVKEQETNLEQIETQKEEFKSTFFLGTAMTI
jgi:hypothetical protein